MLTFARTYPDEPSALAAFESIARLMRRHGTDGLLLRAWFDERDAVLLVVEDLPARPISNGHWVGGEPCPVPAPVRRALELRLERNLDEEAVTQQHEHYPGRGRQLRR